jgi:orotate phosphoribosyltransferase
VGGIRAVEEHRPMPPHILDVSALSDLRPQVIQIVREKGLKQFPEPRRLASGAFSQDFIDGKEAVADGADLEIACRALLALDGIQGIEFEAVGGLTMGADPLAHGIAWLARKKWFSVRKERKGRGTNKIVEGAQINPGMRVLLVDDVVTFGGSIQEAFHAITGLGATVVAAVTLVDRSDVAMDFFEKQGVRYYSVVSYGDLDIEAVHAERVPA